VAEHVVILKWRSLEPSTTVVDSIAVSVDSVCNQSLANACHSARWKSRVITILLCSSGRRPSNTGITHWEREVWDSAALHTHYCEPHLPARCLQSYMQRASSFPMCYCKICEWCYGQK
jgi:hypothetical protein